jgi:transposase
VPTPHDAKRDRLHTVIERTFCRSKDVRSIATQYDKTTRNSLALATVRLVSTNGYWA